MKITFIYNHSPNETWSTPLSLLNEFKERGWETEIVPITANDDSALQLWIQQDTPTDIVLFMDWGRVDSKWLEDEILAGRSITIVNKDEKFYSSAIVGGTISIAMGVAMANKRSGSQDKVWCFVGDMAFETGAFMENYKYAKNFDLPITFVVEDNSNVCACDLTP